MSMINLYSVELSMIKSFITSGPDVAGLIACFSTLLDETLFDSISVTLYKQNSILSEIYYTLLFHDYLCSKIN